MISSKLLTCQCNFLYLNEDKISYLILSIAKITKEQIKTITATHIFYFFIMAASPPDLVQQVSKVRPDWDVVLPLPELIVEMLIIARILLQYHAVSCQQVRKSVGSHGAIHVNLVFVLGMDQ